MRIPLVKQITGVLFPDETLWNWTLKELCEIWGEPERISPPYPFDKTDYYRDIAPILFRRFISFRGLCLADQLVNWKLQSGDVEKRSREGVRAVNIDPGYLDGARLILASTKDHAHRIYLDHGIGAEVTMRYRFGKWDMFDYTFPDFASGIYNSFLCEVRQDWLNDTKERRRSR